MQLDDAVAYTREKKKKSLKDFMEVNFL